jgi:hypothetical protein
MPRPRCRPSPPQIEFFLNQHPHVKLARRTFLAAELVVFNDADKKDIWVEERFVRSFR